jgi:small subunit ribosomal protein S17
MQNNKKQRSFSMIGIVTSDRMNKTRVIVVEKRLEHTKYKKPVKRRVKYKAHDERNESHRGDKVEIIITRPMSREKRWRVSRIIEKAPVNISGSGEAA